MLYKFLSRDASCENAGDGSCRNFDPISPHTTSSPKRLSFVVKVQSIYGCCFRSRQLNNKLLSKGAKACCGIAMTPIDVCFAHNSQVLGAERVGSIAFN